MSKILVGIIGNDAARFHEFTASALKLQTPEGSQVEMLIGGDWCGARNTLAQMCLDGDFTHLWFMDDDHSFPPDLLTRLLAWGVPLVTPMCLTRVFPFAPVSYVKAPPELSHMGDFVPVDLANCPSSGLIELVAGGAAGMLIRRDVLQAIEPPWFEYGDRSEDIVFCEKAIDVGFTLYGDLGARLGHITTAVVIPDYSEEQGWTTRMRVGHEYDVWLKQAYDLIADGRRGPLHDVESSVGEGDEALPQSEAERIEIWIDDELRWWWRAISPDGRILARDSGAREEVVIEAALARFPETQVFHIQREIDDSRTPERYGPPTRLWNRG